MTATLHKVLAGSGYLYYVQQVAAADSTDPKPDGLADYYSAHGEAPGTWHGSGLAALGLQPGDQVTEKQMEALFGMGRHPDAEAIQARVIDTEMDKGASRKEAEHAADKATRLGNPYRVYVADNAFRERCGQAFSEHNVTSGNEPTAGISDDIRARIRTEVAAGMFTEQYGRASLDARELSGWVAKNSRPASAAVAGFDITFSPVKSVSALWAIAPKNTPERIAAAHDRAVDDAIRWLEQHGVYTRLGRNGIRQVDVEGVVAARFTHRQSRAGDPDLHTHVVIANRVRTLNGLWRTLDGAMIYRLVVTVSEIYNSRLEQHLDADLGLAFAERFTDPTKRPIREIVGLPWALAEHWSRRDHAITTRLGELASLFQQQLGREPMPKEMFALMERATLETRPRKHGSRSWIEQRAAWRRDAEQILGGRKALNHKVSQILRQPRRPRQQFDTARIARLADQVVATVSAERGTWRAHHLRSEAERQLRGLVARDQWERVTSRVLAAALDPSRSLARGDPDLVAEPVLGEVPEVFRRRDGASVHTVAGAQSYTSPRRLAVAARLIELSNQTGARTIPERFVAAAIRDYNTDPDNCERRLNAGQVAAVTEFATSPSRIATANAPAGTGKTTAMRVLVDAWHASGGTVLGLAPTAKAAAVLAEATTVRAETVDKLLTVLTHHTPDPARDDPGFPPPLPQWMLQIDNGTLVIVDEHVRLGDDKRLRLFEFLVQRGATIRCVGDDHQLPSIEAGGTTLDTADATLTHVVRFADAAEASASLLVREGDPAAFGFYLDQQRVHSGAPGAAHDQAFAAWIADDRDGRDAVMLAPTHETVTELNDRARVERLARTGTPGAETRLSDELCASAGDIIATRRNAPRIRLGERDWVRNGYRWVVDAVREDGSLAVTHLRQGRQRGATTVLPPEYVRAQVRLGYAATIDSAQGITTDTCHVVLTGLESRNQLYVALTRGAATNHLYVPTAIDGSEASFWTEPGLFPRTAVEVLLRILDRDAAQISPHAELRDALDPHNRLGPAVDIYLDALGLAAEQAIGSTVLARIDQAAQQLWPRLADAPAYPMLRQHLATIAWSGRDPITALSDAALARELDTAKDVAAVLDWRLDSSGNHSTSTGPLPWLPNVPANLPPDPVTDHLRARHRIIAELAHQITQTTAEWSAAAAPVWARPVLANPRLLTDLAVWRAANRVSDTDLRPTGPSRHAVRERDHQQLLDARVTDALGDLHTAVHKWSALAKGIDTRLLTDPWWPVLADRLDTAAAAGIDIDTLLPAAAEQRPLPDEMPAAALWFRLGFDPSALTTISHRNLRPDWIPQLHSLFGDDIAEQLIIDPAWPRLVAAVDSATGWTPADILTTAHELLLTAHPDPASGPRPDQLATALAWRIETILHPPTPTASTESSTPTTTMNSTEPTPETPATNSRAPQPAPHSDLIDSASSVPEQLRGVAELFRAGRVKDANTMFRTLDRKLGDDERDIFTRVADTLYHNSFPVARARLRWAADRYPQHRALIHACIPDTDPHVYQPGATATTTLGRDERRRTAPRDHEQPDQPPRPRPTRSRDRSTATIEAYHATRATVDDDPDHMPIPDAVDHRYQSVTHRDTPDPYTVDYDCAAAPRSLGFCCFHCAIERAVIALPSHRRGDDGLCENCRDGGVPAIPEHDPVDHISARCTHVTSLYPATEARAKLAHDWRHAPSRRDRHAIADWVHDHPFPDTPATPTFDPNDPVQILTDRQLAQHIGNIEQRIALQANDSILFGPASSSTDSKSNEPRVHRGWLRDELADLTAEQDRRARLTPDQVTAEDDLRDSHRQSSDAETAVDLSREDNPSRRPDHDIGL
ncbi:relaxase domain-containing protein [Nocardia sp. CDC159]|uniref:Relaxase domain-containing protein n=1 Tax=Nocardia pulmonis TaxID=2951408 RepID=A0A9X2IWN5_9NOCA|nr:MULTISPECIES: MobF family relaxase [Nocardia]MCM6774518.1 relaxase domain-containing protein [Nocardia pulmonis]MCM6787416.1 relaxase domain-containing protein [Nocardia sp. CDC159]